MYSHTFVIVISRSVSPESVHRFPFAEEIRHTLSYESVSLLVNVSPVFLTVYRQDGGILNRQTQPGSRGSLSGFHSKKSQALSLG